MELSLALPGGLVFGGRDSVTILVFCSCTVACRFVFDILFGVPML